MKTFTILPPDEFEQRFYTAEEAILLDVRTPIEFSMRHLESCMQLDFRSPEFREVIRILDPTISYFVYSETGERSREACEYLVKKKFSRVYMLEGGIAAWEKAGKDTINAAHFSDDALQKLSKALFFND
jgi:rhodanese-related sulfurtransferase